MTIIHVFPGHGSQRVGMGAGLFGRYPDLVAEADAILGYSVEDLCLNGPRDRLRDNRFAQPAMYVVSALEHLEQVKRSGQRPEAAAGHSLGEYVALFAASAFDFGTGLRIVAERAQLMNAEPTGSMISVLGMPAERIRAMLDEAGVAEVSFACFNSPEQTTLSGSQDSMREAAALLCQEAIAVFWVSHTTAPHCARMAKVAERLAVFLQGVDFSMPSLPVISNVTARPYQPGQLPGLLVRHLVEPVRWVETVRQLAASNDPRFHEIGPGTVLTDLIEAITRDGRARRSRSARRRPRDPRY